MNDELKKMNDLKSLMALAVTTGREKKENFDQVNNMVMNLTNIGKKIYNFRLRKFGAFLHASNAMEIYGQQKIHECKTELEHIKLEIEQVINMGKNLEH